MFAWTPNLFMHVRHHSNDFDKQTKGECYFFNEFLSFWVHKSCSRLFFCFETGFKIVSSFQCKRTSLLQLHAPSTPHNGDNYKFAKQSNK